MTMRITTSGSTIMMVFIVVVFHGTTLKSPVERSLPVRRT